jgi:hypothetical protein
MTGHVIRLLADFSVNPNPGGGPGGGALQTLIDYAAYILIGGCVLAIVVGGGSLGFAAWSGNYRAGDLGKRSIAGGFLGAVVILLAAALVHFASTVAGKG